MTSHLRNWLFDTDVMMQQQHSLDMVQIFPVGSRGKKKLNIPAHLLTLPSKSSMLTKTSIPVSGRGKSLQANTEIKKSFNTEIKMESIKEFSRRMENKKIVNEKDWPSLNKKPGKLVQPSKHTDLDGQFNDDEDFIMRHENQCVERNNHLNNNTCFPIETMYSHNKEKHLDINSLFDGDYKNLDFLRTIESPDNFLLIENLPTHFDETNYKETISSFGEISLFLKQLAQDCSSFNALVKMKNAAHCDWVLSCLDGSNEMGEDSDQRLVVSKLSDLLLYNT